MRDERLPPPSVILFFTNLLKSSKHGATQNIRRLVESYAADLFVSNGVVMTPETLLAWLNTIWDGLFMYAKRMGGGVKITPPP